MTAKEWDEELVVQRTIQRTQLSWWARVTGMDQGELDLWIGAPPTTIQGTVQAIFQSRYTDFPEGTPANYP